jgi:hypothetical protein
MSTNIEIERFRNEITCFEENINKIAIIILVIKNNELINCFKNTISTLNNNVDRKELVEHLKSIDVLKDYKIQYILKFLINKSLIELKELNNSINTTDYYNITHLTSLNNITFSEPKTSNFTGINSLIIIAAQK